MMWVVALGFQDLGKFMIILIGIRPEKAIQQLAINSELVKGKLTMFTKQQAQSGIYVYIYIIYFYN